VIVRRYFLTVGGLKLLAQSAGVPPRRYARYTAIAASTPEWAGDGRLRTLKRQFEHTVGVNRLVVRFVDEARRQQLQVVRWLSASDGALRFIHEGKIHWLRPDAVVDVHYQGRLRRLYIEWDRGTVRLPEVRQKLRLYLFFYATVDQSLASGRQPLTLIVTTNTRREARVWEDLAGRGEAGRDLSSFLTTVGPLIERLGPLAAVWRADGEQGRTSFVARLAAASELGE
jgi:hypothetical protein